MKKNILFGTVALIAGSLLAADSNSKDEVKSAAKKLADAGSYSWKSSSQNAGGGGGGGGRGRGGFGGGPREGKISKDGVASISMTAGQNTTEAFVKGDKVVVKNREGVWQTLAEMTANAGPDRTVNEGDHIELALSTSATQTVTWQVVGMNGQALSLLARAKTDLSDNPNVARSVDPETERLKLVGTPWAEM